MSNWVRERFMRGKDDANLTEDFRLHFLLGSWDAGFPKITTDRLMELQYDKAEATKDEVIAMAYELWNRRKKEESNLAPRSER